MLTIIIFQRPDCKVAVGDRLGHLNSSDVRVIYILVDLDNTCLNVLKEAADQLQTDCLVLAPHEQPSVFKLYKLGTSDFDCSSRADNKLPRHVAVDKRGHICYIGSSLTL